MPPNGKIRVLVVDDSALMRQFISDILRTDPRIEVAGTARDGKDALAQIKVIKPDIVTMDVEMPNMDGLKALEEIMKTNPIPVIMVSTMTQTLKALALGCVDFIGKPSGSISLNIKDVGREIIDKVIAASTAKVRRAGTFSAPLKPLAASNDFRRMTPPMMGTGRYDIVAIASSTGGPMALSDLLPKLPKKFPVPIVITQHMPKEFTGSFAKRLNESSQIEVVEGFEGLSLKPGRAVIAPGGSAVCSLSDAPPVLSVKPAANIMFLSLADEYGGNVLCVILTGMGRDGTDGAIALKKRGAYVIAESQKTCVVYGMPKAAADAGIVDEILPLNEIPDAMVRIVR